MSVPERCGPYRVLQQIGEGAMAQVFLARGPTVDGGEALFALKRLIPQLVEEREAVRMFEDEARLASSLIHPNICRVYGLEHDRGMPYQVMEWIHGVSLRELIRTAKFAGGLPIDVVTRIGADVAEALDYAHTARDERGVGLAVVHRDVSPENIMVSFDGRVKLLDFGLAKARTQLQKTRPGFVKGKYGYLAPEQLAGLYDARTDVFQLGLCLYEALVGDRMFPHQTAASAVAAVGAYEYPPPIRARRPDVPAELEAVVYRALERHPDLRWVTAAELGDALHESVQHQVADTQHMVTVLDVFIRPEKRPQVPELPADIASTVDRPDDEPQKGPFFWVTLSVLLAATGFVATAIYLLLT